MLSVLILIPMIGSFFMTLLPSKTEKEIIKIKKLGVFTACLNFLLSLYLWIEFDCNTSIYQYVFEFTHVSSIQFNIGIDGISLYFVLLTTYITPIALLANYKGINLAPKTFYMSFLILESLQILAFVSLDLLLFYIFFESVLPILFMIIVVYGHGEDRLRSAFLLFLYTLAGSLPMLICILTIWENLGSTDLQLISSYLINFNYQFYLWLGFFLAFAVKTPLYPFTIWLPKAHADSPLAGSILLAATILKLATYGYLRVIINFLPDATKYFLPVVYTVSLLAVIYASFSTIIQIDTKRLIAYSSIAHMGVVVLGIFSNNFLAIEGALLLAIAHGFVSPALFICVGGIIYDRTGTRNIAYIMGLATYMPVFSILFLLFIFFNSSIPFSLNFWGEQLVFIGLFEENILTAVIAALSIILSAIYSIFIYNRLQFGEYSSFLTPLKDINRREYIILLSLFIPVVILGIFPNIILDTLHSVVTSLLYTSKEDVLLAIFSVFNIKKITNNDKKNTGLNNKRNLTTTTAAATTAVIATVKFLPVIIFSVISTAVYVSYNYIPVDSTPLSVFLNNYIHYNTDISLYNSFFSKKDLSQLVFEYYGMLNQLSGTENQWALNFLTDFAKYYSTVENPIDMAHINHIDFLPDAVFQSMIDISNGHLNNNNIERVKSFIIFYQDIMANLNIV